MRAATKWICRRMVRKRHMSTKIGPSIDTCMKMPSSTYIIFLSSCDDKDDAIKQVQRK